MIWGMVMITKGITIKIKGVIVKKKNSRLWKIILICKDLPFSKV